MAQREALRDEAAHRMPEDLCLPDAEPVEQCGAIVRHRVDRRRRVLRARAPGTAVVGRDDAVAVGERVDLGLP